MSRQHLLSESLVYVRPLCLQPVCHSANSCYSPESFCRYDLQLSSLRPPPSLVPSLWLKQRSLDPSSRADMTAGDVTSRLSAFPIYLCPRLCLVTVGHSEELDMTGLDVILPLHDPRPSPPPPPARALTPLPLFSMHSHPLSQTLSGDLLRCRHDRCRCHRVSPCPRLMTS